MSGAEPPRIGDSRLSQGRTISSADFLAWAGLVHDFTPLHFDSVMMSSSEFGEPIAHGYIAMNLAVGLFFPTHSHWYRSAGVRTTGWDDVKFLTPVRVGDTLRCRRTVISVEEDGGCSHRVEVLNQHDDVVVDGIEHFGHVGRGE